jgi:4-hydroxybenzoate polyprenyltransferase
MVLAGVEPEAVTLVLIAISISLLYVAGMFLNDAFDQEFDRKYRAERPIPAGEITGSAVYKVGFGLMASGLVLLFAVFPRTEVVAFGMVLSSLIIVYDWSHKKITASPVLMALCRVLVYFCAAAAVGGAFGSAVIGGAAVLMAYMIGLSYVAKQENFKEIRNLWPLVLLFAPFVFTGRTLAMLGQGSFLYLLFLGWVIYSLSHLLRKPKNIPRSVVSLIAGISLLDGLLMVSVISSSVWPWFGVAGFGLTVFLQRFVPGT